ncbi:Vacuolar iron transporter-like 4 [Spatholobus suberectus]|nr:Vacuolar iron transporter-like 4 [Spatholobus suberectus]
MTIREFISMSNDYDTKIAKIEKDIERNNDEEKKVSSLFKIALALEISAGAMLPLLATYFQWKYKIWMTLVVGVSSMAMLLLGGWVRSYAWKNSSDKVLCERVLIEGG